MSLLFSQVSSIRTYIQGGVYTPIAVIGSNGHCACSENLPLNRSENRSAARSADNRLFPSLFLSHLAFHRLFLVAVDPSTDVQVWQVAS